MIPSEMQMEAFEGERQLIQAFVCAKKKETAVQPLLAGLFHVHCAMGPCFFLLSSRRRIWRPLQRHRKQDWHKRKEATQGAQEAAVSQE